MFSNAKRIDLSEMPKAELHLHLEGAPRWSTLREAHHRYYGTVLPNVPPWYAPSFRFTHFREFQSLFQKYIHPWLQSPSGYAEVIQDVVDSLLDQNIRYAEVNVAASLVERHGIALDHVWEVLEAELERARTHDCIIRIFVGLMRNHGVAEAIHWVRKTSAIAIVTGFDLQGDEVGFPCEDFLPAFNCAIDAGKRVKVHAGEMTGPESIRTAVELLDIRQIGHGTSAIHDPEVVALLRERQVTLEMCPTSNERLGNISSYRDHPILALDAAEVAVTVNSDDPTFFGHTLTDELSRLMHERQVTLSDIKRWTQNAFRQALLDDQMRDRFVAELEAWTPSESRSSDVL